MCHNSWNLWSRTLSSRGSYGCETTQVSIGPDRLFAGSIQAHAFAEQEKIVILGEIHVSRLNAGESPLIGEAGPK